MILTHAYFTSREKPSSASVLELTSSDPRFVVEFIDERDGQLFKKNALCLINNGGSEALDVRIEDIPLRAQRVRFPHIAGSIGGNGNSERFEPVIAQYGPAIKPLLVTALKDEWNSYNDIKMAELEVPLTIRYLNFARTFKFTTTCTLVFRAFEEILHRAPENKKAVVVIKRL